MMFQTITFESKIYHSLFKKRSAASGPCAYGFVFRMS